MNYNEQLLQLQEKVSQKKSIEAKLKELKAQRGELDSRVWEFKKVMRSEQADVDRLERISLTSVFYAIIGKKENMVDKEKVEAYAAKVKYDSAVQELNLLEEDISCMEAQLREISGCERQYETLLKEKTAVIKATGSSDAERILQIEEQIITQISHKKEIGEAVSAGSRVLSCANSVLSSLDSAEGWGTWDLLGGGIVSDMVKHSHLDEAQSKVHNLQSELRRFKTELADVTINADMQVNIDGFLHFADYFFDGLFVDWAVMDKISKSKSSVESTKSQIESVLSRLRSMEASADQTIKRLETEKDSVVLEVTL